VRQEAEVGRRHTPEFGARTLLLEIELFLLFFVATGLTVTGLIPMWLGAVGNTPLVRIASLSEATGCEARAHSPSHGALPAQLADGVRSQIYGKAELTNPGGSVKDRVAVRILQARHACVAAASPLL
jgi:hypothetical protein